MDFPVATTNTTNGTTATTTPAINLPASIQGGDLLLVLVRNAAGGTITFPNEGTDWIQLFEDSSDGSDDTTALAWRRADGTEGATVSLTFGTSGRFAALAWRIRGAVNPNTRAPEFATLVTGSSLTPDAGNCTPTGGTKNYLWITMCGMEGENTTAPTFPTNYALNQINANSGTSGAVASNCVVAAAARSLAASAEDAGAFTFTGSADDWTATTVAIHPMPDGTWYPAFPDWHAEAPVAEAYGPGRPRNL